MLDGLNETSNQQLLHFLYYLLFYFGVENLGRLSRWLSLGIYNECMHHQSEVQLGYLTIVPYKDVLEFFQ